MTAKLHIFMHLLHRLSNVAADSAHTHDDLQTLAQEDILLPEMTAVDRHQPARISGLT